LGGSVSNDEDGYGQVGLNVRCLLVAVRPLSAQPGWDGAMNE